MSEAGPERLGTKFVLEQVQLAQEHMLRAYELLCLETEELGNERAIANELHDLIRQYGIVCELSSDHMAGQEQALLQLALYAGRVATGADPTGFWDRFEICPICSQKLVGDECKNRTCSP